MHARVQESKPKHQKQKCSNFCNRKPHNSSDSPVERMLQLQRVAGNQAVQKLIKSEVISEVLQAKLRINQPSEVIYGQEPGKKGTINNLICESCKQKRILQRRYINSAPEAVPPIVHEVLRSPGQPLDSETREFMEPRFGHNFSKVKVHMDGKAAESARAINALAYTVNNNIIFDAGRWSPQSIEGRRLIAHELTHVVQQSNASSPSNFQEKLTINDPGEASERAADNTANSIVSGNLAKAIISNRGFNTKIQRACGSKAIGKPSGCTNFMGNITGERFLYRVNCNDPQPNEQARLKLFAKTIEPGETIEIHGFASMDGNPIFNENLSCARAIKAQSIILEVLTARGVRANVSLFNHGATPDADPSKQRSVVVTRSGVAPPRPAPVPEKENCQIDVRATHIGGLLSAAPVYHLFIVHIDNTGPKPYSRYFRGGPGGSCPGVTGQHGTIVTDVGPYIPGTVDWDPSAPSVTVLTGPAACAKLSCLKSELGRIDSTCTPYKPTGPNSNTVASTMLSNCGIPRSKPVRITPGWDDPNI